MAGHLDGTNYYHKRRFLKKEIDYYTKNQKFDCPCEFPRKINKLKLPSTFCLYKSCNYSYKDEILKVPSDKYLFFKEVPMVLLTSKLKKKRKNFTDFQLLELLSLDRASVAM
uniref:Uncharacterized protein n=1 Tax=Rhizophagus irregularis (strain DAOM 181602 / DAOM 197198 / MUCL 43194) TaxID=747089 RepID=U9T4U9_RHIID